MRILVIDAYSSGRDLVGELRRSCGAEVDVYFQTLPFEPCEEHAGRRPEQQLLDVAARGSYDRIVAGSEPGVSAADWLSSSMNLPCNRPETLWHRRNKVGMIEAAKRAGLRSPVTWRLRRGSDLGPMTDRFQEFRHGVIVKPSGSGGSDSCFICRDESEIEAAVAHVLGSVNLFGNANDEVVVQERIGGEQYFVNTVSEGGRHLVTEMFRYGISESSSTPHIYSAQTIATHDPLYRSGTRYVLDILDSLGVEFAASHTEIRFEDDRWTLIEYNGRSMGPTVPSDIYVPARGFSQVTVLAMMLTQGYEAARALVRRGSPDYGLGWHMPSPPSFGPSPRHRLVAPPATGIVRRSRRRT